MCRHQNLQLPVCIPDQTDIVHTCLLLQSIQLPPQCQKRFFCSGICCQYIQRTTAAQPLCSCRCYVQCFSYCRRCIQRTLMPKHKKSEHQKNHNRRKKYHNELNGQRASYSQHRNSSFENIRRKPLIPFVMILLPIHLCKTNLGYKHDLH